jgi:Opioid growth factor receptor (OGFr) conserved region.
VTERSPIIAFLEGEGPDGRGRTVFDVLAMDDAALEQHHDFIQWLFPLPEKSQAVPGSPVLTPEDVLALQESGFAQSSLAAGTDRMAYFYLRTHYWLAVEDHNHLRITRVIRSLRLLRGDEFAEAFKAFILARVQDTQAPINARSLGFWTTA